MGIWTTGTWPLIWGWCRRERAVIDLRQLARITAEGHGSPLNATELNEWAIPNVVVLCDACQGQVDPAKGEECECGNTGFDWTDTADVQATLRALLLGRDRGKPSEVVGKIGHSENLLHGDSSLPATESPRSESA